MMYGVFFDSEPIDSDEYERVLERFSSNKVNPTSFVKVRRSFGMPV